MKAWYTSKTLWVNAVAVTAIALQGINSTWIIGPEIQGGILAVINVVLRAVTGESIAWSSDPSGKDQSGYARLPVLLLMLALTAGTLLLMSGCANLRNSPDMVTTGKALLTAKGTIVGAAITVDRLCQAKALSPDTCIRARDAYATAKTAYDAAVDSYLLVQGGGGDPAALTATMQRLEALAVNLATLAGGVK